MKYLDRYLSQHCLDHLKFNYSEESEIIVVIPAYNEEYNTIEETLLSLEYAYKNSPVSALVLLLLNHKSYVLLKVVNDI